RPSSAGCQVSPPSWLQAAPPPPASYARPAVRGCQASAWTSRWAPGRWSSHVSPPSALRISPPSSIPTSSSPASCGLGAIQRTCEVHGRGGKLQVGAEGISRSAANSTQLCPPSALRNSMLGSQPAYTLPSTGLTATEKTSGCGNFKFCQFSPPSLLFHTPWPREPA